MVVGIFGLKQRIINNLGSLITTVFKISQNNQDRKVTIRQVVVEKMERLREIPFELF